MTADANGLGLPTRLLAGVGVTIGLVLCHTMATTTFLLGRTPTIFFLMVAVSTLLVMLVRSLGSLVGIGLGASGGLIAAVGLAQYTAAPSANQVAFAIIATVITGILGYLSGCWQTGPASTSAGLPPADVTHLHATSEAGREQNQSSAAAQPSTRAYSSTEEILAAITADFFDWLEVELDRSDMARSADWPAFDQFVRQTLRDRLGTKGVRLFKVSPTGQRLEPLTRDPGHPSEWPSSRGGLIGHVVTSGNVFVSGRPDQGELIAELAGQGTQPWAWLLPLRDGGRTCALVATGHIESPAIAPLASAGMANAVRGLLQLFWLHVRVEQTRRDYRRTDRQSGMLNRNELLSQLHQAAQASAREGEPLMVLTMAIEGLRRLDDAGQWSQRDALVERLGEVLRNKVRSDDLLGRFSDDRFVVVLRRLDSALGTLVAEKLMATVRLQVLDVHDDAPWGSLPGPDGGALTLRAGLAGSGLQVFSGNTLLERAMGLLDYARSQRVDLATDLMDGLPSELARVLHGQPNRPIPPLAPPATASSIPDTDAQAEQAGIVQPPESTT
ncbi:MAG: diguanylate cyclase [Planctomycetes bacterium]|nr:diguanylate cyclase [Planctomycetota bacterium]